MNITKPKKGAEKTISVYWFAILIIVAGAVVYMVSMVYGQPYDVRAAEADILASKAADCISEGGYLRDNTLKDESFRQNFLEICSLNLSANDFKGSQGEYYLSVNFYDFDSGSRIDFSIEQGNANLKQSCELAGRSQPVCAQKTFYVIDKQNSKYRVDIISAVNKADKNL
jgi:hypothetical protein